MIIPTALANTNVGVNGAFVDMLSHIESPKAGEAAVPAYGMHRLPRPSVAVPKIVGDTISSCKT
jgi:hypothetical protein